VDVSRALMREEREKGFAGRRRGAMRGKERGSAYWRTANRFSRASAWSGRMTIHSCLGAIAAVVVEKNLGRVFGREITGLVRGIRWRRESMGYMQV